MIPVGRRKERKYTTYHSPKPLASMIKDVNEIIAMSVASIKTLRRINPKSQFQNRAYSRFCCGRRLEASCKETHRMNDKIE